MTSATIPEKAPAAKKQPPKRGKKPSPRKVREGAAAKAWAIFTKHPRAARKDVVAACVKAGINENTAKTQYQRWRHRNEK